MFARSTVYSGDIECIGIVHPLSYRVTLMELICFICRTGIETSILGLGIMEVKSEQFWKLIQYKYEHQLLRKPIFIAQWQSASCMEINFNNCITKLNTNIKKVNKKSCNYY